MPTTKVDHTGPTVVSSAASPVTLVIEPASMPLRLTITSGASITVTGTSVQGRPIDVQHTP